MSIQEIITKDDEINNLKINLKSTSEDLNGQKTLVEALKSEIDQLKAAQDTLENEKAEELREMSRGKSAALLALQTNHENNIKNLKEKHTSDLEKLSQIQVRNY